MVMPILLKNHRYRNIKKPKETRYINSICPMADRKVSEDLFKDFEDVTVTARIELDGTMSRDVEKEIMETIRGEE
jgi:hypothetical protein